MDEQRFEKYLKETGRKPNVIKRYLSIVAAFEEFLKSKLLAIQDVNNAGPTDLEEYVESYEQQSRKSARTVLYAFMQYFKAFENSKMVMVAQELREPRKAKRGPFPLKEFLGINPDDLLKLAEIGIKNIDQMRNAGKTFRLRSELAEKANVPYASILELVHLSDLERIGYVKKKFTRLFYNFGIKTPEDLGKCHPDELHESLKAFVVKSGWDGITPFKSDLTNYINRAKQLPKIIDYSDRPPE
ncbi:MAG: DUF4332 domain-containing protein [Candidatus Thorarchaeota archaeon]